MWFVLMFVVMLAVIALLLLVLPLQWPAAVIEALPEYLKHQNEAQMKKKRHH